jgi:hypothetical protein
LSPCCPLPLAALGGEEPHDAAALLLSTGALRCMLNQTKAIALEDIKVVREYPDAFTAELPGMPPNRDIEFLIELLPGMPPISKRPYRMPINELVELMKQIAELQAEGFILPSSSPWGAPVLFVEKKDGTQRMCVDY